MAEESDLHKAVRNDVLYLGGRLRKCVWVQRRGAPDLLLWVPGCRPFWIELKAEGEQPEPHQAREHKRMREEGHLVFVVHNMREYEQAVEQATL